MSRSRDESSILYPHKKYEAICIAGGTGGERWVRGRENRFDEEGVECGGEDVLEGGDGVAIEDEDEAFWGVDDIFDCCRAANRDVCAAGAVSNYMYVLSSATLILLLVKELGEETRQTYVKFGAVLDDRTSNKPQPR